MSRHFTRAALVVGAAVGLLAAPQVWAQEGALPPPVHLPAEPTYAIWAQPVWTVLTGLGAFPYQRGGLYLPLGATIGINRHRSVDLELTAVSGRINDPADGSSPFRGGYASAGWTQTYGNRGPLDGFFVTTKLSLAYWSFDHSSAEAMLGVDGGYRTTFGPLFAALGLGVSAGWAFGSSVGGVAGPHLGMGVPLRSSEGGPVVGVNLNLLRLGGAF